MDRLTDIEQRLDAIEEVLGVSEKHHVPHLGVGDLGKVVSGARCSCPNPGGLCGFPNCPSGLAGTARRATTEGEAE